MSIEVISWVLNHSTTSGNDRLVLLGLANHAHPDGSHAFPAVETLARYAQVDRRTAQRRLRALENGGHIAPAGHGPNGQQSWQIVGVGEPDEGGRQSAARGGADAAQTVEQLASDNGLTATAAGGGVRGGAGDDDVPPDFPAELRPHARHVMRVLRDLAERHGAKAVTARSLGNVVMARPRKPLVRAAHDFAAWADGKGRRQRDVVAGYRNWLDREDDLASVERLPGDGASSLPAGVTSIREPRTAEERRAVRQARRMEVARGGSVPSTPYPIEEGKP